MSLIPPSHRPHEGNSGGRKCWAMCCIVENGENRHPLVTTNHDVHPSTGGRLGLTSVANRKCPVTLPATHTRRSGDRTLKSEYSETLSISECITRRAQCRAAVFKLGSADQRGSATGSHGVRDRIPKSSNCLHGF